MAGLATARLYLARVTQDCGDNRSCTTSALVAPQDNQEGSEALVHNPTLAGSNERQFGCIMRALACSHSRAHARPRHARQGLETHHLV